MKYDLWRLASRAATAGCLCAVIVVHMLSGNGVLVADDAEVGLRPGQVVPIAGTGEFGDSDDGGDGGPATDASIAEPSDIATDSHGNVYFVDRNAERIRMIDTDGAITTAIGGGATALAEALTRLSPTFVSATNRAWQE